MRYVDLRSDTVTQPTEEMRNAMVNAIVGDDVYGDDPTIILLEEKAAKAVVKKRPFSYQAVQWVINSL